MSFIVVLITVPTHEIGLLIADVLLDRKLAACVNLVSPIHSVYSWQGSLQNDEETLLVVKSRADLFADQLVPAVQSIHPYQVPEIIALPIVMGSPAYLDWMNESMTAER